MKLSGGLEPMAAGVNLSCRGSPMSCTLRVLRAVKRKFESNVSDGTSGTRSGVLAGRSMARF